MSGCVTKRGSGSTKLNRDEVAQSAAWCFFFDKVEDAMLAVAREGPERAEDAGSLKDNGRLFERDILGQ